MRLLNNLTIGKKITVLTALGLLSGVGVFSALGMRAVNQATDSMLQDRLATASLVAGYVDEALTRSLNELENTAVALGESFSPDGFSSGAMTLETAYSRSMIDTYGIYLLDSDGRLVWKTEQSPPLNGIGLASFESVRETIDTGQSTVSGMVSAPVTNIPVILLAAPVQTGTDDHILVSAIDVTNSRISGFLRPLRLGKTGYAEIVDGNGIVVTRTEPGPVLSPFEKSDHSARFAALISAGEPARGVCHTCHGSAQKIERQDVLAFVPLATADWGVVIRQAEEEAMAPAAKLRQSLVFSGVGLVTVALMFVVITTKDVGTRIGALTSASQRIADGDLTTPVKRLGYDEVGTLATSLDDMRVKLRSSYGDLEQKTRELASLLSVSEIITSTADLPELLQAVLVKGLEMVPGADAGVLLVSLDDSPAPTAYCAGKTGADAHLTDIESRLGSIPVDSGNTGIRKGDEVQITALERLQLVSQEFGVKSSIVAEIANRDRKIGAIMMMGFSGGTQFPESDLRLLRGIADYIAIAVEKSQLTKQAEEARAVYEADRLRSELISSVSHELRSPLTLIKGYSTSLLRRDVKWDETEQREFLNVIDDKTDVLRDLIDKLLQSAKLEAGALRLEREPLLIPQLAKRLVLEPDLNVKKHHFRLDFSPSFPVIEGDIKCLEQVLRNLLQNAVKYSAENTEIAIVGNASPQEVNVAVIDQGIGIMPEDQERVFERFFRVDSPVVHSTAGSGLGLSISRAHIEAHGGKLWLESTPGAGSCFSFNLPREMTKLDE